MDPPHGAAPRGVLAPGARRPLQGPRTPAHSARCPPAPWRARSTPQTHDHTRVHKGPKTPAVPCSGLSEVMSHQSVDSIQVDRAFHQVPP